MPLSRRDLLRSGAALGALAALPRTARAAAAPSGPVVLATWDNRRAAAQAWAVLHAGGYALDAAEAAARIPEADPDDHSVGLGGRPDRDGRVTLDACVMDERHRCGAVAALEDVLHPVTVARMVMERTPHVMLVGEGARTFAQSQGVEMVDLLTPEAEAAWRAWLETAEYAPAVNSERRTGHADDHDTIGVLALDAAGRVCGACTTSGLAYKMRGRVGDSPILGGGLFVDGGIGGAVATGHGEEVIRVAGASAVVEAMRHGRSAQSAAQSLVERVARVTPADPAMIQVGVLALGPDGEVGAAGLQPGFVYVVTRPAGAAPDAAGTVTAETPVEGGVTYTVEAPSVL
ncbi:N(4)-(beta-N-acetylglucosaminyl)-L-asparaginase [Rubrivirga sp. IMCC43871]|uniref:N(4)-(beta-N-acetylglucosaminyl)-L-asparaginase n=1 Tax=Rubrivirga sp. IMCC43871 TaxID=3391575 RepID=UPI00398FD9C3